MKILDAVYKSADRYNAPDNRYGFGIPNFKTAYRLLKNDENKALYGNEWLFATPGPFTSDINATFIGRLDGPARLELLNSSGQIIASQPFTSEKEEVYKYTFANLTSLPAGFYTVKYSDNTNTRSIQLTKGNIFEKDWLLAVPNPFKNDLTIYLKAPETGEINLRLLDAKGSVADIVTAQVMQNEQSTIRFNNAPKLQSGVYFLQYISKTQRRTISLVKGH
jgi:methionine-rich copper-binding protein CopC